MVTSRVTPTGLESATIVSTRGRGRLSREGDRITRGAFRLPTMMSRWQWLSNTSAGAAPAGWNLAHAI